MSLPTQPGRLTAPTGPMLRVNIEVPDTDEGFDDAAAETLFNPFQRLPSAACAAPGDLLTAD